MPRPLRRRCDSMKHPPRLILLDSNAYLRLAISIHPLLWKKFGKDTEATNVLRVIKKLDSEYLRNPRLQSKFHWVKNPPYVENRQTDGSILRQNSKKKSITRSPSSWPRKRTRPMTYHWWMSRRWRSVLQSSVRSSAMTKACRKSASFLISRCGAHCSCCGSCSTNSGSTSINASKSHVTGIMKTIFPAEKTHSSALLRGSSQQPESVG